MNEPITLDDGKYIFDIENYSVICKRYNEDWRDFIGDKAIYALFNYALKLQACLADITCDCSYILPSKNANNPEIHDKKCCFAQIVERIKNE